MKYIKSFFIRYKIKNSLKTYGDDVIFNDDTCLICCIIY